MIKLPVNVFGHRLTASGKWLIAQLLVTFPDGKKEAVEQFVGEVGKVQKFQEGASTGVFGPDVREQNFGMKLLSLENAAAPAPAK